MMSGARFEVAARWDELFSLGDTDPALIRQARQLGREVGLGTSLYLNGHALKIQADWTIRFGDGSLRPTNLFRLQLDATF